MRVLDGAPPYVPEIVHFVYGGERAFSGPDFHGSGVGGTEAGVVVLAEAMARRGMRVTVFTPVQAPTLFRGVLYAPTAAGTGETADLLIVVKQWPEPAGARRATRTLLWLTDVHVPDHARLRGALSRVDGVLWLSPYQQRRVGAAVREAGLARSVVIGEPVDLDDYRDTPAERGPLMIFCSIPERGLVDLARWMPAIFRRVPTARLVVTSDYTLWGKPGARAAFARYLGDDPRVTYAGHVTRGELVRWQRQARVMAYPCRFPEGFCISAAECMAAGAVPVTTDDFALRTTVGDGGILIRGGPHRRLTRMVYGWRFVRAVTRLLQDDAHWARLSAVAQRRARDTFAPDVVTDRVLEFAGTLTQCGATGTAGLGKPE
ncbi:MAG: glycosyltransferase family 4 protein [Gemmatimonadota bacterium]|nr:glycosyltransferase family 4 protein [Gemmatimonadota bacterium]